MVFTFLAENSVYFSIGMKKKFLPLAIIISSLSLSGCSFFDFINFDDTSLVPWDGNKQELSCIQQNLTSYHYYDNFVTMPTTGKPKLLVLPVAFSDTSDFISEIEKEVIRTNLYKAAFGDETDTGWYSISSFYKTESFGKCEIEGEVAPWYQSSYHYDYVDDKNTSTLVNEAVNNWKINNPSKVAEYDTNADGYIDGLLVIYGGPNYSNINKYPGHRENKNMWAYTSWLDNASNISNPSAGVFIWASYDFMENDNSNGLLIDTHTYIHEMGHVFGLEDYYDYADRGIWSGGFSMQDYNVGGHDPYSLMSLGWINPYVPTYNTTITIHPFESTGDIIVLSPDFSANSVYDEYLLIEMYSPTGTNERDSTYQYCNRYPVGPTKVGIRIWHVDARLLKINQSSKRGKTVEYYSIVNNINPNDGRYIIGCSNTTYVQGAETNSYCSLVSELRDYKLLELIRRNDTTAGTVKSAISNDDLFKAGDTFAPSKYLGYFDNGRFNNGLRVYDWTIKIDSLNSSEATISIIL